MTTEDALQAAIDKHPGEMTPRLQLADLLVENGDPRGPGYLAMARLGRRPCLRGMPGYHNGVGTWDIESSDIRRLVTKDPWISSEWKAHNASKLNLRMQAKHRMRLPGGIWVDAIRIRANPIHALPLIWYRACWGEKWWSDEDVGMEWVFSKERRRVDDMVAEAFPRTPKVYQDKILAATLPLGFSFLCPACNGSRRKRLPIGVKPSDEIIVPGEPCDVCKGIGSFREHEADV